jgi:hypothetical protein
MQEFGRPVAQLIDGIRAPMAGAETHADRERTTDDTADDRKRSRHDERMAEVQLFDTARFAADENDIHREIRSNAVI